MVQKDGAPKKRGRKPRAKKSVLPKVEETKVEEVKVEEVKEVVEKPKATPKKKPAKDIKAEAVVKIQELQDWLVSELAKDRSLGTRFNPLIKELFRQAKKLK